MDRLHVPAFGDELRGQPIEQLGMRGPDTLEAEVAQAFARCRGRSDTARAD